VVVQTAASCVRYGDRLVLVLGGDRVLEAGGASRRWLARVLVRSWPVYVECRSMLWSPSTVSSTRTYGPTLLARVCERTLSPSRRIFTGMSVCSGTCRTVARGGGAGSRWSRRRTWFAGAPGMGHLIRTATPAASPGSHPEGHTQRAHTQRAHGKQSAGLRLQLHQFVQKPSGACGGHELVVEVDESAGL
jgi:hypothetical protein